MKPPPFEYFAPTTVEEALSLLEQHSDDAAILAGGQSLVPLLNFRLTQPTSIIDINRLQRDSTPELSEIRIVGQTLSIGALARQREVELSPLVKESCPLLAFAAHYVGNIAVRNRGTFAGSLAHGDPAAEFPLIATLLEAQILIASARGRRAVAASDFFLGPLTTVVAADEIILEISLPLIETSGWGFHELDVTPRALVAAAALLTLNEEGLCTEVRLGLAGVGSTPFRPKAAEELLAGKRIDGRLIKEASRSAASAAAPISDELASADYRAALAEVYLERALTDALVRAGPEDS